MRLWRISKHPGLEGLGGTFSDGRWHTRPKHVIYAAEHPALALAEVLAHLHITPEALPIGLRLLAIDVRARTRVSRTPELAVGWQANETMTRALGDAWLSSKAGLLMRVPSAVVPHATNYLVNPTHRNAASYLSERDMGPFWLDQRLLPKRG